MDANLVFLLYSELEKCEEILTDYKRYKDVLFKLSPPEWQEAQSTKASRAKAQTEEEAGETAATGGKCSLFHKLT